MCTPVIVTTSQMKGPSSQLGRHATAEASGVTLEPASLIELPKPHAGAVCSDARHCVPNVLRKLLAFHASFPLYCERLMRSATAMAPPRCTQFSTELTPIFCVEMVHLQLQYVRNE